MSTAAAPAPTKNVGAATPPPERGGATEGGKRRTAGTFLPCSASVYLPTEVRLEIPTFDGDCHLSLHMLLHTCARPATKQNIISSISRMTDVYVALASICRETPLYTPPY